MNIPRKLVGAIVEIKWCDPNFHRGDIATMEKGRAALATWTEYGLIHDVTDGVVLLAHSLAANVGSEGPDEIARTAVHEALIEKLTILVPQEGT